MLKFPLSLPIIFSSLYISFSWAHYGLPSCAVSCAQTAAYQAGCNSDDPTCFCTNDAFTGAVYSCVWQSCSDTDAQTATDYWATVCGGYGPSSGTGSTTTVTPSGYVPPSSRTSVSGSSGTESSSSGYGYPTVTSSRQPTTSTPITSSNPYAYGGSSAGSSSGAYGSRPSSSTSSNLAATLPTHAAALVAGGIGAMVAVFV